MSACRWELAETFRRLSMTGALVLFPAGSVSQLSTAIFLSLFGLVAYAYFRPYICWEESGVASMAQFQIFVVVFLGLLGKLDESTFDGNDGKFIGVLLVVLTVLVILSVVLLLVLESSADENDASDEFRSLARLTTRLTQGPHMKKEKDPVKPWHDSPLFARVVSSPTMACPLMSPQELESGYSEKSDFATENPMGRQIEMSRLSSRAAADTSGEEEFAPQAPLEAPPAGPADKPKRTAQEEAEDLDPTATEKQTRGRGVTFTEI